MKRVYIFIVMMVLGVRIYGAGEAGMQFLKIGADARGNSLGGAVISEVSGIESLYWNPGGLNSIEGEEIIMSYNKWIGDMSYMYAGFGMRMLRGGVGISITFFNEGEIESAGTVVEEIGGYDLGINIGYGMKIIKEVEVGGTMRLVRKSIFGYSSTGGVIDIGGEMEIRKVPGMRAGIVIKNLGVASGTGDEIERMPIMGQVGISYVYKIRGGHQIEGMVGSDIMIDDGVNINTGIEYGYKGMGYFRVGYKIETGDRVIGGVKGLSVGIGGNLRREMSIIKGVKLDISYIAMSELGNIIQVTIGGRM